jgi:y4mF family transcriptional regulator
MTLEEIGQQVMVRRKQLGLRQDDLAEMSSITKRTIYDIEEGKGNPSFKTLSQLCDILGLEINITIKKIS